MNTVRALLITELRMKQPPTSDFLQFRDPESDEVTVGIVVESLLDDVELPVLARVVSDSGAVVPVAVVAADVVVELKQSKSLDFSSKYLSV